MDSSALVAKQYTEFAYPPPISDLAEWRAAGNTTASDPNLYPVVLWPEGQPRTPLNILSAGCGTYQAAYLAYSSPFCQVTGIDLSETSLFHERKLQERHELTNLSLHQGDLRAVADLGQTFDYIVCSGVLHHLADPDEGLRALASVLAPDGVMSIMLYGRARRAGVYFLQDAFRRLNVPQSSEGVAFVRATLERLQPDHPARSFAASVSDVASDEGIVDLFLHPQDQAYSVPEVLDFVERAGLFFQGWFDNSLYYPDLHFAKDDPVRRAIERLPEREQWAVMENIALLAAKHMFVVRKRQTTQIAFDGNAFLDYVPVRHPGGQFAQEGDSCKFSRAGIRELTLNKMAGFLYSQTNGTQTVRQIINHPVLASHPKQSRKEFARAFYGTMWRQGHIYIKTERPQRPLTRTGADVAQAGVA
jgi:SAM-dependent methyltransferase